MRKLVSALCAGVVLAAGALGMARAQEDTVKIAMVHGLSGSAFEVFSKQITTGFNLGLSLIHI